MALVSVIFCQYYVVIIGYTIFYFTQSFSKDLPWVGCHHSWNTENCFESGKRNETVMVTVGPNATENVVTFYETELSGNATNEGKPMRSTEEYWTYVFTFIFIFIYFSFRTKLCNNNWNLCFPDTTC